VNRKKLSGILPCVGKDWIAERRSAKRHGRFQCWPKKGAQIIIKRSFLQGSRTEGGKEGVEDARRKKKGGSVKQDGE